MRKYKNFLITGYARSGTKFLSHLLNRSKIWTVEHEPNPSMDEFGAVTAKTIQQRLDRHHYGEVNSTVRWVTNELEVGKRGVIYRHPVNLWASVANGHTKSLANSLMGVVPNPSLWGFVNARLVWAWKYFEKSIKFIDTLSANHRVILFHQMVSDKDYAREIIKDFGITDIKSFSMEKKNKSAPNMMTAENMPDYLRKILLEEYGWFIEKYGLEEA